MNSPGASHLYSTIYDNEDLVDWRQIIETVHLVQCIMLVRLPAHAD